MPKYSCTQRHYQEHVALHRAWTKAVGTLGYVKSEWVAKDNELHANCKGGCLKNPPPLDPRF